MAEVQVPIRALLHPEEDGGYWAEVPALPGCVTEGDTLEEVLANVREAAGGCLEAIHDRQVL
jgi:predicted RNase H-like HicB family nuclease